MFYVHQWPSLFVIGYIFSFFPSPSSSSGPGQFQHIYNYSAWIWLATMWQLVSLSRINDPCYNLFSLLTFWFCILNLVCMYVCMYLLFHHILPLILFFSFLFTLKWVEKWTSSSIQEHLVTIYIYRCSLTLC